MPTPAERAQAQARYLEEVNAQAKIIYERDKAKLPIDPQGRVLLQVKLDANAWEKIYRAQKKIKAEDPLPAEYNLAAFKQEFEKLLGHPVTATTSVSYDIQTGSQEPLNPLFKAKLESSLVTVLQGKKNPEKLSEADRLKIDESKEQIIAQYQNLAKGRIISLHQETHFHAHLIGRMVRTAVDRAGRDAPFGDKDELFQKGLDNALLKLNEKIQALEAKALVTAYKKVSKTDPFDEEAFQKALNKELDAARKKILPEIAKAVRVELIKATGIQFDKDITQHLTKELAKSTSASLNDTVHISRGTGAISYIGASEKTSHHQQVGAKYVADQTLYSHHLKESGVVQALAHRQQVRVPALAVKVLHKYTEKLLDQDDKHHAKAEKAQKKGLQEPLLLDDIDTRIQKLAKDKSLSAPEIEQIKAEYELMRNELAKATPQKPVSRLDAFNAMIVTDTAQKIQHLQSKYQLGDIDRGPIPKAFVYNLYTSLNRTGDGSTKMPHPAEWYDERNNKQTQSADHILKAAHEYNRNNPVAPLCLVQNVPVNGWGHNIDIDPSNPSIVNEAALMGQLAALHTIYDTLSVEDKNNAQKIFADYKQFLTTPETSFYDYVVKNNTPTLAQLATIQASPPLAKPEKPMVEVVIPVDESAAQRDQRLATALEDHRAEFLSDAKHAMAALFKAKAFNDLDNGFTYQALSVFAENASIGGCKSANERAQAVNGRAAILDFVSLDKATRDALLDKYLSKEEAKELKTATDGLETAIQHSDLPNITKNMNTLYGSLNLEGFQALISFIDQGGHAKLSTKGELLNTNSAEPVHTNVKNASKWQCHKGLTDNVLAEFNGVQKFSWLKEMKGALKPVAAAIGATGIGLGIAAAVGITAGFPPAGLVIAAAAGVTLLAYTLFKVLPKWWASREAATQTRFDAIQENNRQLVEGAKAELEAQHQAVHAPHQESIVPLDFSRQRELRHLAQEARKSTAPQVERDRDLDLSDDPTIQLSGGPG
ncbi:hypothetical protein [Legionella sp. km772]|uniref:hypothetical protein n=1 Tax=Legionella sp. km772 TaxID=2498111 RepID=UPI000F8D7109|nr:hypothetical protein [Legionella sp. km772]RUR13574.1 hypothetical protein ELY15_01830 [Legionella sp. km772]